jgi:hypothetical protein
MDDRWLFYLDADGWLVGPESAPFPDEARTLNAALAALGNAAAGSDLEGALLHEDREPDRRHEPTARYGAA